MSTAANTPKVVVLTGASDGIGAAAARALAREGHHIVPIGRSAAKTRLIATELGTDGHVADFAHLDQVRKLAGELASCYPQIDVLINNAGLIAGNQRTITSDAHELTFQVNHLAPFLLTTSLHDQLVACAGRVITTSSAAGTARDARIVLDDLDMNENYDPLRAYKASKLANVLFTRELERRWGSQGVSAAAFHPGLVRSQWGRSGPTAVRVVVRSPLRYAMRSPERGADTLIWLATAIPGVDWRSGGYYSDRKPAKAHRSADDPNLAADLWSRSGIITRAEAPR